ncbi:hypothetical protein C8Q75DRAFT_717497 [Abortiporus biennis]|nr:hypothetical protein C8Q75DRAFT_717497 [Abortiporus biennis]
MPTATMTEQELSGASLALKSATTPSTLNATAATLRSLYPRAAKAFLQRDISLTQSLLSSAFSILPSPAMQTEDTLASHRRKWDVLRITFETTLYTSPPSTEDPEAFPAALRSNQMLSPSSLITMLYDRSLQLFTPAASSVKSNSAYLPIQVLTTLILASLKLGCPEIGRSMIEDWLARRHQDALDATGYSKIIELYCLQVLPRLEEWDYIFDFLQYERELDRGNAIATSVRALRAQMLEAHKRISPPMIPDIDSPSEGTSRTVSPAPSMSSESSTSTHTATPLSPRPDSKGKTRASVPNMTTITPTSRSVSSSSQSLSSVATSRTITPDTVRRSTSRKDLQKGHIPNGTVSPLPRPPRSHSLQSPSSATSRPPSTIALIRSYMRNVASNASRSKIFAFVLFFLIFPLISFCFRLRQRRITQSGGGGAAEEVRRKLKGVRTGALEGKGIVGKIWEEAVRAVTDTVKMGGRGLV